MAYLIPILAYNHVLQMSILFWWLLPRGRDDNFEESFSHSSDGFQKFGYLSVLENHLERFSTHNPTYGFFLKRSWIAIFSWMVDLEYGNVTFPLSVDSLRKCWNSLGRDHGNVPSLRSDLPIPNSESTATIWCTFIMLVYMKKNSIWGPRSNKWWMTLKSCEGPG